MKPINWPRYMVAKALSRGGIAYYWRAPGRDSERGFSISAEALGTDFSEACERSRLLNQHLDSWRLGKDAARDLDLRPGFATLGWLVERYMRSRAWEKVSARSRPEYERALNLILDYKLRRGQLLRSAALCVVSAHAVDRLYTSLQKGARVTRRLRQANVCMSRMARAWDVVRRLYPDAVPSNNPWRGVELEHSREAMLVANRQQAYALHHALVAAGEPHLAVVPLICFELHQRPENVLAGHLSWTDYRPPDRPNAIRIVHHKTGELAWLPLSDNVGALFPELTSYLDNLERLGVPMVLMRPKAKGAPARPFKFREARRRVRKAAVAAGLPAAITLAACRRGGLTELGDADLTEQSILALSGHRTPEVAQLYVKRTEVQRLNAARKRRAWVDLTKEPEQKRPKSRNGPPVGESE